MTIQHTTNDSHLTSLPALGTVLPRVDKKHVLLRRMRISETLGQSEKTPEFLATQESPNVAVVALCAAWTLLLGRMTNTSHVSIAVTILDQQDTAAGIVTPTSLTFTWTARDRVFDFLQTVDKQVASLMPIAYVAHQRFVSSCTTSSCAKNEASDEASNVHDTLLAIELTGNDDSHPAVLSLHLGLSHTKSDSSRLPSRMIQSWMIDNLPDQIQFVACQIHRIANQATATVADIELASPQDIHRLWAWNQRVPEVVDKCIHDMIKGRADAQPDVIAINAWDGSLTYGQLDQLATKLASKLAKASTGSGSVVPLCFEKSMWTAVAVLGVLKAGAAFVLLDPALPEKRLESIIQQVNGQLIVSSSTTQELSLRLHKTNICLRRELFDTQEARGEERFVNHLHRDDPGALAYISFTSGSTGVPKGVMITHRNAASALHHQSELMALTSKSRVYDFASYSFDVSINNIFATLTTGACLHVPSSEDRNNNLEQSIISSRATVLDLTPSVARLLDPSKLPQVHTVIFSGEALRDSDVKRWWDWVPQIHHAYGPSECTPTSTFNTSSLTVEDAVSIGRGSGTVTWIVSPEDDRKLLPPGYTGELLVEGPLVGPGYLKNEEMTAAAFVQSPPWLLQGSDSHAGRQGRLYKTGDLVRYDSGGKLFFVGRKDSQVKIRGQRVELAEIEHVVKDCVAEARQVVVEVISGSGSGSATRLTAFLEIPSSLVAVDGVETKMASFVSVSPVIEKKLDERLPGYMVPNVFIAMQTLPTTPAGKTDRRELRNLGTLLLRGEANGHSKNGPAPNNHHQPNDPSTKRLPQTKIQQKLQQIWGRVLNLDSATIGLDDGFLRLGGDSITAMQACSMARTSGIDIRVIDILQKKTISNLANSIPERASSSSTTTRLMQALPHGSSLLSPIQRLYLHLQPDPAICFDQYFFLQAHRPIEQGNLRRALEEIVQRHDSLRARFKKNADGAWELHTASDAAKSFQLHVRESTTCAKTATLISKCRETLDLLNGPILAAVLLEDEADSQKLFLTVHHAVVDLVSWRIVLRELEELLTTGTISTPPPFGFQKWISLQARYSIDEMAHETAKAAHDSHVPLRSYWGMERKSNLQRDVISKQVTIDQSSSSAILTSCQNALDARPFELTMASLIYSFGRVFKDRTLPRVFSEGHGREPWDDDIDISSTVGWFTTLWPLDVSAHHDSNLQSILGQVKQCVQALRKNGWTWFTSQFANESSAKTLAAKFPVEILFNYEGSYQQLERQEALFERLNLPNGTNPESNGEIQRFALFEIACSVQSGRIVTVFEYHKNMHHQPEILEWIESFQDTLLQVAKDSLDLAADWDLVDTMSSSTVTDSLDASPSPPNQLHHDERAPVTIPQSHCSETVQQSFSQERLWFMDRLYPDSAWPLMAFAVRLRGPLQLAALTVAFNAAVRRHEVFRTTFHSINGAHMQTVHSFQPLDIEVVDISADPHSLARALELHHTTPFNLEATPGWRVSVFQNGDENNVFSIVMHHIIYDGWSIDILRRELALFYSAAIRDQDPLLTVDPLPIQYRDFSVWERAQSQTQVYQQQLDYWMTQLETSRPARLLCDKPRPSTLSGETGLFGVKIESLLYRDLQNFCRNQEVTLFSVLLAVFGATISRLSGVSDATIGIANASRDVGELQGLIGCFINMQCIRIKMEDETFVELTQQVQETVLASLSNKDIPFDRVVSKLQLEKDLSRHPVVQTVFTLHSQLGLGEFTFEGVETEPLASPIGSRLDIEFHVYQGEQSLRCEVVYSKDLYKQCTIENMTSAFSKILEIGLSRPNHAVASLPLFSHYDYVLMDKLGLMKIPETEYPRASTIVDVFRQQVAAHADKVSVKDSHTQLTYSELDRQSDRTAQWLRRRRLTPETLVGVLAPRSCETIVAFIGILKASLAYLPLDVRNPPARIQTILDSVSHCNLVLVSPKSQSTYHGIKGTEFVNIADTLSHHDSANGYYQLSDECAQPSSTSLAVVLFTSGSTGQPKGVKLEHRSILRLVMNCNHFQDLPAAPTMAHIASIAFDMAFSEIYTALLNGGTVVCIGFDEVLDPQVVAGTFFKEGVNGLIMTPALMKQYVRACPRIFSTLQWLGLGGDKADMQDLLAARKLMQGKQAIVNAYGPTENTGASLVYTVQDGEQSTNGVPIGRVISNSGAYVMDAQQQLVPLGFVGELVVTGDGLARGYVNPQHETNRFVRVTIGQERVRAYRTGDFVRYRPSDAQLEFLGRMDGQVKIRGQRVELGEIEHILSGHESVSHAAAVLIPSAEKTGEARIAGFAVVEDDSLDSGAESQLKDMWKKRFDDETSTGYHDHQSEVAGKTLIGGPFPSDKDATELDALQMKEWLDDTVKTIYRDGQLGHVLEVGSGYGTLLLTMNERLQSYVGVEPSGKANEFVVQKLKSKPNLAEKIRMIKSSAADIGKFQLDMSPINLVLLNSVIQYFPSKEYLMTVIRQLLDLKGLQRIFVGDVLSHTLNKQRLAAKAIRASGDGAAKTDVREIIESMEQEEHQLLIDPAFFTALARVFPDKVAHVEILPKLMHTSNEMSCYRYAAVIHTVRDDLKTRLPAVDEVEWIDYKEQKLNGSLLLQMLQNLDPPSRVCVANIPNRRTIFEREIVRSLGTDLESDQWLSSARQRAEEFASLSAVELVDMATQTGRYRVALSWARQHSQQGGLDAIFYAADNDDDDDGQKRTMFQFPMDNHDELQAVLSNAPLRTLRRQNLRSQLQQLLQDRLPPYMVPHTVGLLDKIPVNVNGKLDVKALTRRAHRDQASASNVGQGTKPAWKPTSETERKLRAIWAQILNIEPDTIGPDDSFFQLGGDSITAMAVSAAARESGIGISIMDVLKKQRLSLLSASVASSSSSSSKTANTEIIQVHGPQPFPLSPIQNLYFQSQPEPNRVFDQAFWLKLSRPVVFSALVNAIEVLVKRHDMLRARFSRTATGQWQQRILGDLCGSFRLEHVCGDRNDLDKGNLIRECRERLNIEQGPLLSAILFDDNDGSGPQSLFVSCHHAVIDYVSWRVLFQDLESVLAGIPLPTAPMMSFQTWCVNQVRYAAKHLAPKTTTAAAAEEELLPLFSYWGLDCHANLRSTIAWQTFTLDAATTAVIMGPANKALGTRPMELMLAALFHAFSTVFSDRATPPIMNEGHGREPWDDRINVSRTVGWFTTMHAVSAPKRTTSRALRDTVRHTKDSVRALQKHGWTWFTSRFADADSAAAATAKWIPAEITFNYTGVFQQLERADALFEKLPVASDLEAPSWWQLQRTGVLEVVADLDDGRLRFTIEHPRRVRHLERIVEWTRQVERTLEQIAALD